MTRRGGLLWVLLAMLPGLVLAHGCGGIRIPSAPWPVRDDGSPLPKECVVEGPIVVGEDSIPRKTWEVVEGCDVPAPTPEPAPTPTPEPTPAPTPTPGPTPAPEPTPAPSPAPTCPAAEAFTCGAEVDGTDHQGATVEAAIRRVIESRPSYLVEIHEWTDPQSGAVQLRARLEEADLKRWTVDVANELRAAGFCAHSGDPHGRSPDEILLKLDGHLRVVGEQYDLAGCGFGWPGNLYCVGTDTRGQPHDCTAVDEDQGDGGGVDPLPTPEPPDPDELVLCDGFGQAVGGNVPDGYAWRALEAANRSPSGQWLPLTSCGPAAQVDRSYNLRPWPDGLKWDGQGPTPPCYGTNTNVGAALRRQHRSSDGAVWAGSWFHASEIRYYGAPDGAGCPVCTETARCAAAPERARVSP